MIEIKLNRNVIAKMVEEGFFPDTMMTVLTTMKGLAAKDYELLDELDDNSKSRRMILVYYDLVRRGILQETPVGEDVAYTLTEKGEALLKELEKIGEGGHADDTEDWIQEWIELFPKGVKSGGKLLRSDAKSCLIKMKKFRKEYGYDKNTIFAATLAYLSERRDNNYEYTRCAVYFINKKDEGSDLAAWCEKMTDTKVEPKQQVLTSNYTGLV